MTCIELGAVSEARFVEAGQEFSCASFPADLSEAQLVERYGQGNVRRAAVFGADDGPQDGAVLFDGSPLKLELVWWDPEARTRLAWARTREPNSPWRTSNGIAIGLDLLTIERRNGWPFRLAGLGGPEGRGLIRSWGRGRLQSPDSEGCRVSISLQAAGDRRVDSALYRQVMRGTEFSSGHPVMQTINPQVVALIVSHDPVRDEVTP
jgi:hypothetical protein